MVLLDNNHRIRGFMKFKDRFDLISLSVIKDIIVLVFVGLVALLFTLLSTQVQAKEYREELVGSIPAMPFTGKIKSLQEHLDIAGYGDTVKVVVNSPGGFLVSANLLYLKQKKAVSQGAKIECEVKNLAASAAAVFLLGCTSVESSDPEAIVVFHLPYYLSKDGQKVRDPMLNIRFVAFLNTFFQFKNKMGARYENFLMGFDVWFKVKDFEKQFSL